MQRLDQEKQGVCGTELDEVHWSEETDQKVIPPVIKENGELTEVHNKFFASVFTVKHPHPSCP